MQNLIFLYLSWLKYFIFQNNIAFKKKLFWLFHICFHVKIFWCLELETPVLSKVWNITNYDGLLWNQISHTCHTIITLILFLICKITWWTKNLPPAATLFMTPRPPAPRVAPQLVPPAAAELIAMFWIKMILNNVVRGLARSDQYWRTYYTLSSSMEPAAAVEPAAEATKYNRGVSTPPELSSSWSQLPAPWAVEVVVGGGQRQLLLLLPP